MHPLEKQQRWSLEGAPLGGGGRPVPSQPPIGQTRPPTVTAELAATGSPRAAGGGLNHYPVPPRGRAAFSTGATAAETYGVSARADDRPRCTRLVLLASQARSLSRARGGARQSGRVPVSIRVGV